ncbi:MAG: right-handed parallel beta-helix repeat-containing protein [Actinobacteria bacterium]|nr:right-handed parallel beta-helix repeat-containing protein [Actinomycetota bacterium]
MKGPRAYPGTFAGRQSSFRVGVMLAVLAFSLLVFLVPVQFTSGIALGSLAVADPTIHIIDDSTGGDCPAVGVWNAGAHKCTLSRDILVDDYAVGIEIDSDGVTLDGAAHTIGPFATAGVIGVNVANRTGVTIENLNIQGMFYGVYLQGSSGNMVSYVNALFSGLPVSVPGGPFAGDGIRLEGSDGNVLLGNNLVANYNCGIEAIGSSNNVITGNTISANGLAEAAWGDGILLQSGANGNSIFENWIESNIVDGISIMDSAGNTIHRNNFVNNPTQAVVTGVSSGNSFNMDAPNGGNYWSDYDSPATGCNNLNGDVFCDAAYILSGGQDNLPWTTANGWTTAIAKPALALKVPSAHWASYADYVFRELTVDWTLANNGTTKAFGARLTGNTNTDGVTLLTALPSPAADIEPLSSAVFTLRYQIPENTGSWRSSMTVSASDGSGTSYTYP